MVRAAAILSTLTAACAFPSQGQDGAATFDAEPGETAVDAAPPSDAAWPCVGAGVVVVCEPAPTEPLELTQDQFDTDTDPRCATRMVGDAEVCLVWATTITVALPVKVSGSRPLVLAAADQITSQPGARLDASANLNVPGPGGNGATCVAPTAAESDLGGAGGGAGGSFQGRGGDGGEGDLNDNARGGHGSPGIAAAAIAAPTALRGGCGGGSGGAGGDDENVLIGGAIAGAGGGAIALLAGSQISLGGPVLASGGGGIGATVRAGGGGGGSGGMIVLAAPVIEASAALVANGGGGGESGVRPDTVWVNGLAGANGLISTAAAPGGDSAEQAEGEGGDGSSQASLGGTAGDSWDGGGGGGGGGAGFIYIYGELSADGIVSPLASHGD